MSAIVHYIKPRWNSIARKVASMTDLDVYLGADVDDEGTEPTNECYVHATIGGADGEDTSLRIDKIAGSLSEELTIWTQQGARDVIQMLEMSSPMDLNLFAVRRALNSNGYVLESGTVFSAELATNTVPQSIYTCSQGDIDLIDKYQNAASIYHASHTSPVWVKRGNMVYVYPFDNAQYSAWIWTVDYPMHGVYWTSMPDGSELDDYDESNIPSGVGNDDAHGPNYRKLSAIDSYIVFRDQTSSDMINDDNPDPNPSYAYRMPEKYNDAIAYYVAIELIKYRQRKMMDKLPTAADYSGTMPTLAEDSAGWEKVRWYIEGDEDLDLASAKMQELTGEQQVWMQKYSLYTEQMKTLIARHQQFFQIETGKKEG